MLHLLFDVSYYQDIYKLKNTDVFDKVYTEIGSRIKLSPLRRMMLPYTISNLRWLNPRSLIVLDSQEKLHLLDVRAQDNLETLDMSRVGISYASSHFKGLSTGGNVSKVMKNNAINMKNIFFLLRYYKNKIYFITGNGISWRTSML